MSSLNGSQPGTQGLDYSFVCVTSSESTRGERYVNKDVAVCTDQTSSVTSGVL